MVRKVKRHIVVARTPPDYDELIGGNDDPTVTPHQGRHHRGLPRLREGKVQGMSGASRLILAGTLAVVAALWLSRALTQRSQRPSYESDVCQPCDIRTDELEGLAEWWSYYERRKA